MGSEDRGRLPLRPRDPRVHARPSGRKLISTAARLPLDSSPVKVLENVQIDAHVPKARAAFLVTGNAGCKIVWHGAQSYTTSTDERVPLDQTRPRNCGLR